jgi:hypothetical protein
VVGRADAAQHQLLRASQRPRREDHLVGRAAVQVRHVGAALRVAVHHASRHRLGPCKEELQRGWRPKIPRSVLQRDKEATGKTDADKEATGKTVTLTSATL